MCVDAFPRVCMGNQSFSTTVEIMCSYTEGEELGQSWFALQGKDMVRRGAWRKAWNAMVYGGPELGNSKVPMGMGVFQGVCGVRGRLSLLSVFH